MFMNVLLVRTVGPNPTSGSNIGDAARMVVHLIFNRAIAGSSPAVPIIWYAMPERGSE